MAESWSCEDKRKLLLAIRKYGATDLDLIQNALPHKSIMEIRSMFDKYKSLAQNKFLSLEGEGKKQNAPTKNWIEILRRANLRDKGPVHDLMLRVFKYIALYEKRSENTDINLSDAYKLLGDLSSGVPAKELDARTKYFLYECLTTLAEALRKQDVNASRAYFKDLQNFEDLIKVSPKINPLNVPKNLLHMTQIDLTSKIFE